MEIGKDDLDDYGMNAAQIQRLEELRRQQFYALYHAEQQKIQNYAVQQNISLEEAERQYHAWLESQIDSYNSVTQGNQFPFNNIREHIRLGNNFSSDVLYYTLASAMVPAHGQTFSSYLANMQTAAAADGVVVPQHPQHPQQQMETETTHMYLDETAAAYGPQSAAAAVAAMYGGQLTTGPGGALMVTVPDMGIQQQHQEQQQQQQHPHQQQQAYVAGVPAEALYQQEGVDAEQQQALLRHMNYLNSLLQQQNQSMLHDEQQRLLMLSNPGVYSIPGVNQMPQSFGEANGEGLVEPMMSTQFPKKLPLTAKVVREGYLMKRGEHIRNWRRRYFVLREDGTFFGFKSKPKNFLATPLNNFTVRNCKINSYNKPKPYCFALQGLQWTTVVLRLFFVESEAERQEWISSIKMVADRLKTSDAEPTHVSIEDSTDELVLMESEKKKSTRVKMEDFDLIKVLGKGTFGKVILCRMKDSGQMYAMKLLKKTVLIEKEELAHTYTECRVLRSMEHPFMTKMRYSFTTPVYLCFVMEYVNGGELFYHLNKAKRFPEDTARFYGAEITSALGYMHNFGVIYRDLKLENILLDQHGHIKIADFGLCKEEVHNGESTKTFCGTPEYLAPEVLRENDYDKSVDWWGLGVVMFEMLCGRLPFYSKDHEVLFELIMNENVVTPPFLSAAARDLLLHLLVRDPSRRLGGGAHDAIEVMAHIFFAMIDWDKLVRREIPPPWKPDVKDAYDTKYIPDEFINETVHLTPPTESMLSSPDDVEPYFRSFSFHGSRQSLIYGAESIASNSHTDLHMAMGSPIQE